MTKRVAAIAAVWAVSIVLALTRILDAPHCLLLAGAVTALIVAWPHGTTIESDLPELPLHSHPGGRRDLSELSWSLFDRSGRATPRIMARVTKLADEAGLADLSRTIASKDNATLSELQRWLNLIDHHNHQGES